MKKYSIYTAAAVVIANMVGTGVFTSLGYQLVDISSPLLISLLWLIGGIAALCGALCYAELASRYPGSGGEFNYISRAIHPSLGFTAGWISTSVGFAAPTALVAVTCGTYLNAVFNDLNITMIACALIIIVTLFHAYSRQSSSQFQTIFTWLKVLLILGFIVTIFTITPSPQALDMSIASVDWAEASTAGFAISLIYVSYAYTGWNAATYIAGEIDSPQKNLPRALIMGTVLVTVLYLLLNLSFLYAAPMDALKGKVEVGFIAAQISFGDLGAKIMSGILALLLISTASAMTLAGPRVIKEIGTLYPLFDFFAKDNNNGVPMRAIITQSLVAIAFVLSSSFEQILVFSGATLAFISFITVSGLVISRFKHQQNTGFTAPLYPVPAVIFLSITGTTLVYLVSTRIEEAIAAALLIGTGLVLYLVSERHKKRSA